MFDAIFTPMHIKILAFDTCNIVPDVTSLGDDDEALVRKVVKRNCITK